MRYVKSLIRRLIRDSAGNILPLAAVGVVVSAAVVGSAIDFSRDYRATNQLQSACDAGVLAARRTATTAGLDEASKTAAKNYFATNFDDSTQETSGTSFTVSSPDDGQTVNGAASTTLKTLIMRLFGFDSFNIQVRCASSMGVGNADVMMVLDTTGSMDTALSGSQTRIQALRAAMKNFYRTLATATASSNARVRYGFVPYSSTVNVGRLLYALDPSYIADSWNYQSRQAIFYNPSYKTSSTTYSSTTTSTKTNSQSSCPSNTNWADNGAGSSSTYSDGSSPNITVTIITTQPQVKYSYSCSSSGWKTSVTTTTYTRTATTTVTYTKVKTEPGSGYSFDHWEYRQVSRPTNTFKTFASTTTYTGDNGAAQTSTWNGCIEERATTTASNFSYSSVSGYSPSNAYDINIDAAPSSGTTRWGPQWYQISYTRGSGGYWTQDITTNGDAVAQYCPVKAQLLATMSEKDFDDYADTLKANGGTYLDIGMIWGGRMISPDGIFKSNVTIDPSNGGEVARHIIFMTDGQMDTSRNATSAWGIDWWDRRVTTDGSESTADARHTARFLATCEAIKAKGIRIWVIAFTSSLSGDLQTCASDDSSYTAGNAADLDAAFQEIAKQVGELRVTL